jgi:hypothetical protein
MYMSMTEPIREQLWDQLLLFYHETLINSMADILKCTKDDPALKPYSLENFLKHFAEFGFYGVMICFHFLPWMACPEEECQKISEYFDKDMYSEEFKNITQICGGQEVDDRLMGIAKHAYKKGYLNIFKSDC